jgi:division protein CdvB (Snf7/Vps24/ESCRT-III family)
MIETTKEIEKEMQEAMSRWMRELQRISQIPDAMELLEDAMEKSGFSK